MSTKKTTRRKKTADTRKTRQTAAVRSEHPPDRLTPEHVNTLSEQEKNVLRAEAARLLVKYEEYATAGGWLRILAQIAPDYLRLPEAEQKLKRKEALAKDAAEWGRLRDLIRCGMLPGETPPVESITRERKAELRERGRRIVEGGPVSPFLNQGEWGRAHAYVEVASRERERERLESILAAVEERGSIFAPIGDLWLVADGGRRAPLLEDSKGMPYIHALLRRGPQTDPANGLTPRELCGMFNLLPPGGSPAVEQGKHTPTQGTDADGRAIDYRDVQESRGYSQAAKGRGFRITPKEYAAAVKELKQRLRDETKEGNIEEAKTIRKALRELGEGDPKRKHLPPDKKRERMRDSVRRAIGRALAEIERHHAPAAEYLREHLKTERGRWRYTGKPFTT